MIPDFSFCINIVKNQHSINNKMKTGKILKICGSITKNESLDYFTGEMLENSTVAEANQPYSNYYGQVPDKPRPNSLFLFTAEEYSLEVCLRFTQSIDICTRHKVNAASAIVFATKTKMPAIRIRNFPDYKHIRMLQQCYVSLGVGLVKRNLFRKEAMIKVNKCFRIKVAGEGLFFDMDDENEGYFTIPYIPYMENFEILLQNIRNNSSYSLFDAAYGGLIINGKVHNIIRIYSGHIDLYMLKCIKKEALKWIEIMNKIQPVH